MSTLLQDSFTDTNGTLLTAHTMDVGGGWSNYVGTSDIQSNKASGVSYGGNNDIQIADAGQASMDAYVDVITPGSGGVDAGIVANATGTSASGNFWLMRMSGSVGSSSTVYHLYEVSNLSFTLRATSSSFTPAASTAYRFRLLAVGNTITGYVDGVQKVTYTGSPRNYKTNTKAGIRKASGAFDNGTTFDNFLVTTPPTSLFRPPTLDGLGVGGSFFGNPMGA